MRATESTPSAVATRASSTEEQRESGTDFLRGEMMLSARNVHETIELNGTEHCALQRVLLMPRQRVRPAQKSNASM